jgi:translocation and assembly module TamA
MGSPWQTLCFASAKFSQPRAFVLGALLTSLFSPEALAAKVVLEVEAPDKDVKEVAKIAPELSQYADKDISPAQIRRLFATADDQIRDALQPLGYYSPRIESKLEKGPDETWKAIFEIDPGDPVIVDEVKVSVPGPAGEDPEVKLAVEEFGPKQGDRLDHSLYEKSKTQIDTALRTRGYLGASTTRHQVAVTKSANTAQIDLEWDPGPRHRFGEVQFSEAQFPEKFLRRHVPWTEGTYYTNDDLLALQQRLVDADYFSSVAVTPRLNERRDAVVPIDVLLVPAKRTVYTADVYVSSDSGPGVRLGVQRRWLNKRGHKLGGKIEYSTRLQEISTNYRIPYPGVRNRNFDFGVAYRDEETDSSRSRMARIAATEVLDRWKGFTRTLGLQYLNGDFEIADQRGKTSLLYAEGLLTRKKSDDIYFPTSGYSLLYGLRASAESVLSDTSLVQVRAEGKWLTKVGEDGRFITRGALGAMTVKNFDALPPELRFFAGGDRSIRGFDYQQIGETNASGGVIGGEYQVVASAEYEHYFLENWGAAVFVDAGDAFTSKFDLNVGTGVGLRWKSPVGMVRLDVGYGIVTDLEQKFRIHITIGPDL